MFAKDCTYHWVKFTSELGELTHSIAKSYLGRKHSYLSWPRSSPCGATCSQKKPVLFPYFFPLQPIITRQNQKSIGRAEPEVRPQWCTSHLLPFLQAWISPESFTLRKSIGWVWQMVTLSPILAVEREEVQVSASNKIVNTNSNFFGCLHNNNIMFAYRTAFALLLYL